MKKPIYIEQSTSFQEIIEGAERENEEALVKHKRNGGVCQRCGKNKAEFPNGFNSFHCKKCNDEAEKLVKQLRKDPGFVHMRLGRK